MPLLKCSSSKSTPKKAIAYITDEKKAALVSVRNLFEDEDYAKQFAKTAAMFGKGKAYDERKYYHFKLSCARKDNVSPQEAHIYAEELTARLFPDCECVIATHNDTQTVHSHIVVNAVHPLTGRKLHITENDYGSMKDEANQLGVEMGFSYTEYRKSAKNKRTSPEQHIRLKGGTSWKEELREVIEEGIKESKTPDEFKAYLEECYDVKITRDGKDYSYLHPQKQKPIRGAKLGENYTKTEVLRRIGEQKNWQKSGAHSGRNGGFIAQPAGTEIMRGGGQSARSDGWRIVSRSVGGIQRAMQELDKSAEYAAQGLDAASEERRREQQRVSEELARQQQERDEQARNSNRPSSNSEDGNGSGNAKSFGKGD